MRPLTRILIFQTSVLTVLAVGKANSQRNCSLDEIKVYYKVSSEKNLRIHSAANRVRYLFPCLLLVVATSVLSFVRFGLFRYHLAKRLKLFF